MKANPVILFLTTLLSVFCLSPLHAQATVQADGNVTPFPDPNPTETWDISGNVIYVGENSTGSLTISAGGSVHSGVQDTDGFIGYASGGQGSVTVTGEGSQWLDDGAIHIGNYGNGTLRVENGGYVSFTTSHIGNQTGSEGNLIVAGEGSQLINNGYFNIGHFGNATVTIEDGGLVSNAVSSALAATANSVAEVTVTGAGSQWINGNYLNVGHAGTATLRITDGAHVSNTVGSIGAFAAESEGSVTVTGQGSQWNNSSHLNVGRSGTGTLSIEGGGLVSSQYVAIGYDAGSEGHVTVTGSGSQWANEFTLFIGESGTGTLLVENGGHVSTDWIAIGANAGSSGQVTVTGANSQLDLNQSLYVGGWSSSAGGTGGLLIENGGTVSVANNLTIWDTGTVTVDNGTLGVGGDLLNEGNIYLGNSLTVGGDYTQTATGTLSLLIESKDIYSALVVEEALTFGGTLEIVLANDYNPASGDTFLLFAAATLDGDFSLFDLPTLNTGLAWDYSQVSATGQLSIAAVPEPSTYAAIAGVAVLGLAL